MEPATVSTTFPASLSANHTSHNQPVEFQAEMRSTLIDPIKKAEGVIGMQDSGS